MAQHEAGGLWRQEFLVFDGEQHVSRSNARPGRNSTRMHVLKYPAKAISGFCFGERGRNRNPTGGPRPALMEKPCMARAECLEHAVHGMLEFFRCRGSEYVGLVIVAKVLDVGPLLVRSDELLAHGLQDFVEDDSPLRLVQELHLCLSSVRGGATRLDDRAETVAIHEQPAPELRNGLWAESPQHGQLRFSKRFSLVRAGGKLAIELPHDGEAERVISAPQVCHHGSRTSGEERSDKTGDSLLSVQATRSGVTGGEGGEGRAQTQVQDLACLEETILAATWQKDQRRARRIFGTHDSVCRKVDDPVFAERLLLQRPFGGRFPAQNRRR